ncbi:hypothetical protein AHF37_02391, partial [Paragonimus kellicotti]
MSQEASETEEDMKERSESNVVSETTEQSDSFPIRETIDDQSAESINIGQSDDQPTGGHEQSVSEEQYNNNANEEKEDNVEKEEAVDSSRPEGTRDNEAESGPEGITIISESDSKVVNDVEKTDVTEADSKRPTGENEVDEGDQDVDVYSESEAEVFRAELKPKRVVDPEFTYNLEELVSRPTITEDSGIPEKLLTLHHSFGFDALRRENLQLLEPDVICYLAGNYLEILNLATEEKKYIRTIGGVGVGAFSVHPKKTEIAIAEKDDNPLVCIYRYPNLDLYRLLLEGTQKEYAACQFSPDGEMIATVGSDPDYMLTLWEWRNEQIVLRAKAFSQDIYRVSWSADLAGILTTAGAGHIRFWKMANTFTGLKLQGKLGKFGKTELSDIEGFVILPDGKVLTGCAWGNLLVWDGDLIKVQISRKNKRPCHTGLIMHIVMDEGELMTVGQDGWIRTWDFETIDTAECLEEGGIFELEPMNELQVSPQAKLSYLVKVQGEESTLWYAQTWDFETIDTAECLEEGGIFELEPMNELQVSPQAKLSYLVKVQGEESTLWYAQDADGALWKLDLSFSHTSLAPESLKRFHSDAIRDCVTSPFAYTAATIGMDGRVFIHDLVNKTSLLRRRFPAAGTKLIWSPPQVDPKGKTLVAGFEDGVVRVLQFGENPETDPTRKAKHFALLDLGQALKPHVKAINSMAYNEAGTYFVTGSEDATVFFFAVHSKMLTPIGFVEVGGPVVKVQWTPNSTTSQGDVIVFLRQGCVLTIPCPSLDEVDQTKSFALLNIQPTGGYRLLSIKSKLLHEEQSAEKLQRYELEKKARQDLRTARAEREPETEEDAQRLDDEEELIRQGVMSEIADWAPSYPAEPSPMTYASLDPLDPKQFWLAFDDFDAGYLYKCKLGNPPVSDEEAKLIIKRKKAEKAALLRAVTTKDDLDDSGSTDRKKELEVEETDESDMEEIENRELEFADHLEEAEPVASAKFDNNDETTITCWTFSSSGYRLFAGLKDGCIRVQILERPFDLTSFKGFWFLRVHDNKRGAVTRITLTHDEKFVISVSQDGTFFVYDLMSEELQNKEMKEYRARIPSAYEVAVPADDIVDPKARSIEQAKQKAEYDRLMNLVEQKKAETRKKVTELRLRFKQLKEQNEKLPERIRLGKEEFNLVPHIRADLLKERAAKIDLVYRETAWMSEKYRLALEKLQNANLDDGAAQKKITSESSQQQMKGARGLRVARKLHVLEEAQRRRQARRAQSQNTVYLFKAYNLRNAFNKTVIALRDKKIHLLKEFHRINGLLQDIQCDLPEGEPAYKLEIPVLSSEEYPEREFTYTNSDLLRFKREREELTEAQSSQSATKSLATNTTKASVKGRNAVVHVFSEALYPQSVFRSELYIDEEESQSLPGRPSRQVILIPLHSLALELCVVSLRKQLTQCALKQPPLTGLVGTPIPELIPMDEKQLEGFDGVRLIKTTSPIRPDPVSVSHTYIKPGDAEEEDGDRDLDRRAIKAAVTPESDSQRRVPAIEGRQTTQSPDLEFEVSASIRPALTEAYHGEVAEQKRRQIQALYQRQELINSVGRLVRCFDAEVRMTRHARFKLDVLLKRTELHQLTLFEEFRLLKDFEKSEMVLTERKQLRDSEKSEVNFKELNCYFTSSRKRFPPEEQFSPSHTGSDESADSSSSSSDESSFDESGDESDEDENILDLDTCPVGCPLEDYENTCAIRERRLDVEEDISEEKKALDLLKKDLESWSKKQRIVEAAQKQAHSELEAFQLEKQRKLNELDTVVILRLNQIEYHLNGSVPADLSAGLIFERCNLDILHQRIRELQDEKKQQRREQKEAKDRHVMLQKHKRLFQKELEKMTTVCDNEMIDKFGKIDNIERMESVVVNPKLEELTTKMLILQEEFEKEEFDMEEQIRKARDDCIAQIRENTAVLSQTLMLFNEKEHLQSD